MMFMVRVEASNFVQDSIVESGIALGNAIVEKLQSGETIIVSFVGMRGLSSSYFNPMLQSVKQNAGLGVIGRQLLFDIPSAAQQSVFNRSLDAANRT